jgi:thiamine kinase-like enzyme
MRIFCYLVAILFHMNTLIKNITEKVFGSQPTVIEEIKDKGKNNLVFKITIPGNVVILRLNNRVNTLELYRKEKWCADIAISAGIKTPKIIEVGTLNEYAFSFQEFIDGTQGGENPEDFYKIWFTLGQIASSINKIPAQDIKIDYKEFIDTLFFDNYFIKRNVFSQEISEKIEARLRETTTWVFLPKLCHGNIRVNNAIKTESGDTYIIDWETATGNILPQSELAEIYTWNTGKDNIAHFLKGYGLNEDEVMEMMRDIQTLILLRLVHVIVRKMPKDNNWENDVYIKDTSKMLSEMEDYNKEILFKKNL